MKKRCQRGLQKSCFVIQNGDMGLPGLTYPVIFDVLVRCQKILIFGRPPDRLKNRKNWAVERQRVGKGTSTIRRRQVSGREGSQGSIESRTLWPLKHPEGIPIRRWAEGLPNIFIYVFICFLTCWYIYIHIYIYVYIYIWQLLRKSLGWFKPFL